MKKVNRAPNEHNPHEIAQSMPFATEGGVFNVVKGELVRVPDDEDEEKPASDTAE